jgi:hypothetical protein
VTTWVFPSSICVHGKGRMVLKQCPRISKVSAALGSAVYAAILVVFGSTYSILPPILDQTPPVNTTGQASAVLGSHIAHR